MRNQSGIARQNNACSAKGLHGRSLRVHGADAGGQGANMKGKSKKMRAAGEGPRAYSFTLIRA
jgi:hypothetical protein